MLLTLEEALTDRERQYSEFKASTAEAAAAARALVGFANSRGGQVFFGVTDDGTPKGIQVGATSIEKLTTTLEARIYPSLPLEVDEFPAQTPGKRVVRVWAPADKPPIIGAYLYSSRPLNLDDRLDLSNAQAYRRVGRQTQKIDLMWLRGLLPSDPLVMIDSRDGMSGVMGDQLVLPWQLWHASGGVAFGLTVTTDPPLGSSNDLGRDLPAAGYSQQGGNLAFNLSDLRAGLAWTRGERSDAATLWVVARYRDEFGSEWESQRRIRVELQPEVTREFRAGTDRELIIATSRGRTWSTPEFSRRLVSLPPKRLASPT